MARYPIYVHGEVQHWLSQHRSLERRADWLLAELGARGVAGRPKGVIGPAREVVGLPSHRWRRSGLGGFDYYAWWFEAGESAPFPPGSRVVRAIRHHDVMERLGAGEPLEYAEQPFEALHPLTDEQAAVACTEARIRLAVGHPGTGKTGALLYALIEEARPDPVARFLYLTLSQGLADDARLFLDGIPELQDRVEVMTYEDLLVQWSPRQGVSVSNRAEESAFLGFLGDQPRADLNPWQNARSALWAEVRAHLIGRALPFAFASRGQPASDQPLLERAVYLDQRQEELGVIAATRAWRLGQRFVESQSPASLHRRAWTVLERVQAGRLDGKLRHFAGLVVDEIQDLTLLQLAVLVEAARRIGQLRSTTPTFIAAGDESQVVHPSGFDWGVSKDLLRERLGADPRDFQLVTNQRSPSPLVEASNRTAGLYDELPKAYRPQARVAAEKTEATNGHVYVCQVAENDPHLQRWLEMLLEMPAAALMVCPGTVTSEISQHLAEPRLADLLYGPALVKGLDRQYVAVLDASRVLGGLREDIRAARNQGDRPRYLSARRAIDEFRVAVSRSNETLVFLDRAGLERDPLLRELVESGPAEEVTMAYLSDVLETREYDPLERLQELFKEASDLLEVDPARALRSLERADGALAALRDPESRRQAHQERVQARRRAAAYLLAASESGEGPGQADAWYEQAADQFAALEQSYRELAQSDLADLALLLAERYRAAPPGSDQVEAVLPQLARRYVQKLASLSPEERRDGLLRQARAWRDELVGLPWKESEWLRLACSASELLAELTSATEDAEPAAELRARLVDRLFQREAWPEALAVLEQLPEPPAALLARCYEGLQRWERAAELREAVGDLEQALVDYRQAGELGRATILAERLGRPELAASLRAAADLVAQLGALGSGQAGNLTEAERRRLADQLHRAADQLAPRARPRPDRHRR